MKILSLSQTSSTSDSKDLILFINRFSLAIVFFWFGFLKVISISPAEGLVKSLYSATLSSFIEINSFVFILGVIECIIGIMWLFPKLTKWTFALFSFHMFTTFLPLIFLTQETWQTDWALTLTGQYIVKNVVLVACALTIYMSDSKKF
ncbi:MAG: DUF417 family protein [Saprospiraceae bacterium]|nr:DUF417 family protein [Candidatus Vicinibacter affinis]HQX43407.1 DUF417 family protein [Saprospiraceae bacterium]MBK6573250.1 DUF417 family protein [Candidatus Vicinibacter affinis]MBK6822280.1 DUF417 family protein [Candidatus Vicinibacter affinis]MBK7301933.1 DUF417 family protein [Candidatus Vicinibacter affinis]